MVSRTKSKVRPARSSSATSSVRRSARKGSTTGSPVGEGVGRSVASAASKPKSRTPKSAAPRAPTRRASGVSPSAFRKPSAMPRASQVPPVGAVWKRLLADERSLTQAINGYNQMRVIILENQKKIALLEKKLSKIEAKR